MNTEAAQANRRPIVMLAVLWALADTLVVFGVLGWLYGALIAVFYPDNLSGPVVSWLPIRRDTFAAICFGLSAAAYLVREIAARFRKQTDV